MALFAFFKRGSLSHEDVCDSSLYILGGYICINSHRPVTLCMHVLSIRWVDPLFIYWRRSLMSFKDRFRTWWWWDHLLDQPSDALRSFDSMVQRLFLYLLGWAQYILRSPQINPSKNKRLFIADRKFDRNHLAFLSVNHIALIILETRNEEGWENLILTGYLKRTDFCSVEECWE